MSDLIDRKELLKTLENYPANTVLRRAGLPDWNKTTNEVRDVFQAHGQVIKKIIEAAPVVDAEPVRRGKWVYNPNANDWGIGGYVCGECHAKNDNLPSGKVANPMIFLGTKYCPNCGAKMDAGE